MYEQLTEQAAVPKSAKQFGKEDKDGNTLYRIVVFNNAVDNYLSNARKQGYTFRKFEYNIEKYKEDEQKKVQLEEKINY